MSELKPCPFCGGAAHFFKITDLDDRNFGGDGICCGSCPVTTDLMFSLMEDCKPKLAEAWNRREQPAQVVPLTHVLVPVDEPTDEMIDAACAAVDGMYRVDFVRAYVAAFAHLKAGYRDESYWCGWNAAIKSQQAEAVPQRPDIIEKLTYHARERDDMTLDDCLSYLNTNGWHKVRGRTERELILQITALLAAAPVAQQPQAKPHKPLFAEAIAQHPGLREELKAMDDPSHPLFVQQAEAVPMTDPQLVTAIKAAGFKTWDSRMWELKRQIEAHHGIVGKEGA